MTSIHTGHRTDAAPNTAVGVIDAHAHVWCTDYLRYPFGPHDGIAAPSDARTPADFFTDVADADVRAMLLIQPRVYGYDHAYLFDTAEKLSGKARVMPLINVARPHSVENLRQLAAHEQTAGIRVIALGAAPADWLCSPQAHQVWQAATHLELPVGLLVDPPQLGHVARIAAAHPGLTLIVDHLGRITASQQPTFAPNLRELAALPNICLKVSALDSLSQVAFPYRDMWPLIAAAYRDFGARRLLWGSDWPHTQALGTYRRALAATQLALSTAVPRDLEAIFATTAARLFQLPLPKVTAGNVTGGNDDNT